MTSQSVEFTPNGAVNAEGDVLPPYDPIDDPEEEQYDNPDQDLVERDEGMLVQRVLDRLPPDQKKEVESVFSALEAAQRKGTPCKKTEYGVPVASLIGKFESIYHLDEWFVAIVRSRVYWQNRKFEHVAAVDSSHSRQVGDAAITLAHSPVDEAIPSPTTREPLDWQRLAAGEKDNDY